MAELTDWQRHGVKVTEDCETCEDGLMCVGGPHDHDDGCRCPDCGGTGKKLRDDELRRLGYVRLDPHGDLRRLRLALRKHGHEYGLRAALREYLDGEET